MKKIFTALFTMALAASLVIPCFAAEYTGANDYGDTVLTVEEDGSFTYQFSREAFNNRVNLLAVGTIVDGTVTITSITNPEMDNYDVTAVWDHAEIGAELMTLYTGEEQAPQPAPSADASAPAEPPAASGDVEPMDPAVLEPLTEIVAGTYTGNNDFGPVTLEVSPSGAFTYSFDNSAFGNIVSMVASGSVVDGEFLAEQIINPTMNNFDATDTYNLTEFGYQVKAIYLGFDWNTEAYKAVMESNMDPELATRIEASRIPTLIVTIILLIAILVITALVVYLKYKRRWPPKGTVVEKTAAAEKVSPYTKHQVVQVTLYGDTVPVTISADDAEKRFAIHYTVMGTDLSAEGEIENGEYVLNRDASPMVKNMLGNARPLMTDAWAPGDRERKKP